MDGPEPRIVVTDTLSGERKPFTPMEPGKVRMYVCGLTPYDRLHAGHGRAYVAFDTIRRWLEHRGFDVVHVQNITDIDDRIIGRANDNGEHPVMFAKRMHDGALDALGRLRVSRAHHWPKVSDHIAHIVQLIEQIIDRGHAYAAEGNVYFDVASFDDYGKLSNIDRERLLEESRKESSPGKRNVADFALWKAHKPEEGISWDSPWGPGRPGWHIECSAMATAIFGPTMDIHGGGRDLQFPHHENEIAQSECGTGVHPFVRYWIHAGFLTVDGEKMSKSLGNFITVDDVLAKHRPEAIRLFIAGTHYRSPIDFSWNGLATAEKSLDSLLVPLHRIRDAVKAGRVRDGPADAHTTGTVDAVGAARAAFGAAMDDDFDTPTAIAAAHTLTTTLNASLDKAEPHEALVDAVESWYAMLDAVLAIVPPAKEGGDLEGPAMDLLVEVREGLRKIKAFELSDRVRDRLAELGVVVEDTPQGPRWRRT